MSNRKAELETLRADLTARLERYEAHQQRKEGALDKDSEERAQQTQNDEVVDSLEEETRAELSQIKTALERIEHGVGDECEVCGETIDPRRLQVLPYTTVCVACAEG
ncbi:MULTISPECIES: TraR/DksA family transcriptional regulator [unclassified Marinobacter]|uniref:TraR/DksA family transcriptional regulator n=1 Tax=unclassified Marinobacter TaxID=83889 RepID=UPI0026E1822B|nr:MULTISPECIES: TraR/DksA family transcriptional regulator [unclassified Marinobacter]MDO6440616.1 TraR/DksA family transcriptional regulator [Marinobacter sp. 2_MG-2023]MDO6823444.1 TraR/DksA family transcriptional regulator [Marinobacter sp. 1_MG-2023]